MGGDGSKLRHLILGTILQGDHIFEDRAAGFAAGGNDNFLRGFRGL